MPLCLTLIVGRYGSRVKWSNPGNRVTPPTLWYSSYWKGSLRVTFDYGCQLYFLQLWISQIVIIIIVSRHQHGDPWPFHATLLYRPLLPAGLQGYIPYRHRAAVCCMLCSSMWRGPWEYIPYEPVLTSPAVSCMFGSSNLDSFRDGW